MGTNIANTDNTNKEVNNLSKRMNTAVVNIKRKVDLGISTDIANIDVNKRADLSIKIHMADMNKRTGSGIDTDITDADINADRKVDNLSIVTADIYKQIPTSNKSHSSLFFLCKSLFFYLFF